MYILGTGTVRQNRLNKVPIKDKKAMDKKSIERGFTDTAYLDDIELVAWKDNRSVYVASNKYTADTSETVKRWCRVQKKNITVPTPKCVQSYNSAREVLISLIR